MTTWRHTILTSSARHCRYDVRNNTYSIYVLTVDLAAQCTQPMTTTCYLSMSNFRLELMSSFHGYTYTSRSAVHGRSQMLPKHDFGHFRSSQQHSDVCLWLARYGFLLVICGYLRLKWNHYRVINIHVTRHGANYAINWRYLLNRKYLICCRVTGGPSGCQLRATCINVWCSSDICWYWLIELTFNIPFNTRSTLGHIGDSLPSPSLS